MAKYARGKHAVGMCGRCGCKVLYKELKSDGQYPGLRVCEECYDKKHPVERPFRANEGIALRKPSPDIDDMDEGDVINDANVTLLSTLDGNNFGGGT